MRHFVLSGKLLLVANQRIEDQLVKNKMSEDKSMRNQVMEGQLVGKQIKREHLTVNWVTVYQLLQT